MKDLKTRKQELLDQARDMKIAYGRIFGMDTPESKAVLADLERFCRRYRSCFHPDARVHALLEGRREIILRIEDFLELSEEELVAKYGGKDVPI